MFSCLWSSSSSSPEPLTSLGPLPLLSCSVAVHVAATVFSNVDDDAAALGGCAESGGFSEGGVWDGVIERVSGSLEEEDAVGAGEPVAGTPS